MWWRYKPGCKSVVRIVWFKIANRGRDRCDRGVRTALIALEPQEGIGNGINAVDLSTAEGTREIDVQHLHEADSKSRREEAYHNSLIIVHLPTTCGRCCKLLRA